MGAGSLWLVHKGRPVGVASSLVENKFDIQTLFWTNFEGKFFILISLEVSNGELKPEGAKQPPSCILDSFNKILKIFINIPKSNHSIRSYMWGLRPPFYS